MTVLEAPEAADRYRVVKGLGNAKTQAWEVFVDAIEKDFCLSLEAVLANR